MGLFGFSGSNSKLPWVNIESVEHLNDVLNHESERPKLFFKHSTRCSISSMALSSFEGNWTTDNELCELYFIDLLRYRDVSNAIADITGIIHQSPQAIVVRGEKVLYEATHSSIDARQIESLLQKG